MVLAVAREDAERAIQLIQELQHRGLNDVERAAAEAVVDLDAEEAACPACSCNFKPGVSHCPECGLRVSPD